MRHAAGSTRTAPRRRSTRALLVGLLSASLLTTGSSSLATGDVDVEPTVAPAESVVAEPVDVEEPAALATPVAVEPTTEAVEDIDDATTAEPNGAVATATVRGSAGDPAVASSSTVAPMATSSWTYRITSSSPSPGSRIVEDSTIDYALFAGVSWMSSSADIEAYLTLTDDVGGALLQHVTLAGNQRSQGSLHTNGHQGTWDVGSLSSGFFGGGSATASFRATVGADAPEGTLTATITGNARGNRSGGHGAVSHTIDYRHSTITVNAGEVRTGLGANAIDTAHTEGARYALYSSEGAAQPHQGDWATCTTAADGECQFEGVPPGQYWVGQIDSAAGSPAAARYRPITTVTTGTSGAFNDRPYRFRTPAVDDGDYTMPAQDSRTGWAANSDVWANRLANPELQPTCQAGLNIAVLMDLSGSVAPSRDQLRDAAKGFVNTLAGTGSGVALFSFGDASPRSGTLNYTAPLNVDSGNNASTLANRIDQYWNWTVTDQGTNWDAGLWAVASSGYDYDLVMVLTDGNPTFSGNGDGNGTLTTFRELERAVFSANTIKHEGSRVITVGIGAGLSDHNLSAISGPAKHQPGADINDIDYLTSSWQDLQPVLEDFAAGLSCNASVTVDKIERDADGNESPGAGWTFTAVRSGDGELTSNPSQTTDAEGRARFDVGFEQPEHTAALTITETQRPGWALDAVTCSVNGGAPVPVDVTGRSFALEGVGIGDRVACTVVNVELASYADLDVTATAWPSFARDYNWTVEKSVQDGVLRQEVAAGENATFGYEVLVSPSAPKDTNFVVAGQIRVVNPNSIDFENVDIAASLPHPSCTLVGGTDVTVPADETTSFPYTCTLPGATASGTGTVIATASWDAPSYRGTSGSATAERDYDFASVPPATSNASVDVTDSDYELEDYDDGVQVGNRVWAINGPVTFTYEMAWPSDPGTCVEHTNTAQLSSVQINRQTSSSVVQHTDSVTVEVCAGMDLNISNTVAAEHVRAYSWTIDKAGDASEVVVDENGKATVNYTVEVVPDGYTDSDWEVHGSIIVTNPNDWLDITAEVGDSVDIDGGAVCTVAGDDEVDVLPEQTVQLDYACTFTSQPGYSGTSTATVVWGSDVPTPMRSAVATADITEAAWNVTETKRTIEVLDDKTDPANPVTLGTAAWNAEGTPESFTYPLVLDGTRGTCVEFTNTAWIPETGQDDTWTVEVCWPTPGITVVKSAWNGATELPDGMVTLPVGTAVSWQYEVTNTGTSQLDDIEVTDTYTTTGGASGDVDVDCPASSLAPGNSMTCTGSGPVGLGVYGVAAP